VLTDVTIEEVIKEFAYRPSLVLASIAAILDRERGTRLSCSSERTDPNRSRNGMSKEWIDVPGRSIGDPFLSNKSTLFLTLPAASLRREPPYNQLE